jgi:hypothetical protein
VRIFRMTDFLDALSEVGDFAVTIGLCPITDSNAVWTSP